MYRPNAEPSVHLTLFPEGFEKFRDDALAAKWETIRDVRRVVTGALELERAAKNIGSSLEASPLVYVSDKNIFNTLFDVDLAEVCITSNAMVTNDDAPAGAFTPRRRARRRRRGRKGRRHQMRAVVEDPADRRRGRRISRRLAARRAGLARMEGAYRRRQAGRCSRRARRACRVDRDSNTPAQSSHRSERLSRPVQETWRLPSRTRRSGPGRLWKPPRLANRERRARSARSQRPGRLSKPRRPLKPKPRSPRPRKPKAKKAKTKKAKAKKAEAKKAVAKKAVSQESRGQEGCQIQESFFGNEGDQEGVQRRRRQRPRPRRQRRKKPPGSGKKSAADQAKEEEKEGQISVWPRTLTYPSPPRRHHRRDRHAGDRPGLEALAALRVRHRPSRRGQGHAVLRPGAGLECRDQLRLVPDRQPARPGRADRDQGDCRDRAGDLDGALAAPCWRRWRSA